VCLAAPAAAFGVVGVNAGYPFTYYTHLPRGRVRGGGEDRQRRPLHQHRYDPSYTAIDGRHTTQACANSSLAVNGNAGPAGGVGRWMQRGPARLAYASSQSAPSPTAWWLDVETANSWSSSDVFLNRYTIQAPRHIATVNDSAHRNLSTSYQWNAITAGYQPPWMRTGGHRPADGEASPGLLPVDGFTGAPVWLVQYVTSIDNDYVC